MNYLELQSDDLPAYIVKDYIDHNNVRVALSAGASLPTQDLMAKELDGA